ncbi:MAG TPA: nucleotide exchange factor GrpE [Terriglobales bacterium]|nr:nucleotide exchange factor GrpE [Terriglobales bacterium]
MSMADPDLQGAPDPDRALPPEPPEEAAAEAIEEQVRKLREERDGLQDRLLRTLAEADNARKRAVREVQDARVHATAEAVKPFLSVLDSFERALRHSNPVAMAGENAAADWRKGVELLHRQLTDAARKVGLEPVEAAEQKFDPHLHEAIEMVPTEAVPEGTVVEELQRGYKLHGRLIRPAMVKVAQAPVKA